METNLENSENQSNSWGGARPNSGRPKGSMNRATIEKKAAENEFKQRVLGNLDNLFNAQINLAKGVTYVYRIDENEGANGKVTKEHVLVTDPDEIKDLLDEHEGCDGVVNDNYYYITTKAPDNKAIDSMIDRVFGKAVVKSQVEANVKTTTEINDEQLNTIIRIRGERANSPKNG